MKGFSPWPGRVSDFIFNTSPFPTVVVSMMHIDNLISKNYRSAIRRQSYTKSQRRPRVRSSVYSSSGHATSK